LFESELVGRTLAIGQDVRLTVTGPCSRCVMTTLPQGDLPRDPGILRPAAAHNDAKVGIYGRVECGGWVCPGDPVRVEEPGPRGRSPSR
jgi:MOSC domain-containing protein